MKRYCASAGANPARPLFVPAVMLSIQLCGVGSQNPCRITLLAKFTPDSSSAGPVSGPRAQRRFCLAGPLLRTFRLAARRRVRSPDRPPGSPRPGLARSRVPHPPPLGCGALARRTTFQVCQNQTFQVWPNTLGPEEERTRAARPKPYSHSMRPPPLTTFCRKACSRCGAASG